MQAADTTPRALRAACGDGVPLLVQAEVLLLAPEQVLHRDHLVLMPITVGQGRLRVRTKVNSHVSFSQVRDVRPAVAEGGGGDVRGGVNDIIILFVM